MKRVFAIFLSILLFTGCARDDFRNPTNKFYIKKSERISIVDIKTSLENGEIYCGNCGGDIAIMLLFILIIFIFHASIELYHFDKNLTDLEKLLLNPTDENLHLLLKEFDNLFANSDIENYVPISKLKLQKSLYKNFRTLQKGAVFMENNRIDYGVKLDLISDLHYIKWSIVDNENLTQYEYSTGYENNLTKLLQNFIVDFRKQVKFTDFP